MTHEGQVEHTCLPVPKHRRIIEASHPSGSQVSERRGTAETRVDITEPSLMKNIISSQICLPKDHPCEHLLRFLGELLGKNHGSAGLFHHRERNGTLIIQSYLLRNNFLTVELSRLIR